MDVRVAGHGMRKRDTPGEGVAVCQCGAHSGTLPSHIDRAAWHDRHIVNVLAGKTRLP